MGAQQDLLAGTPVHFAAITPPPQRTVDAAWIVAAVNANKPVDVEWAVITGALNLKYTTVEKELRLKHCEIQDAADLSYCNFKQVVDFSDSKFALGPDFQNSRFEYELLLRGTHFASGVASCSHATVARTLDAEGVIFDAAADAKFDNLDCDSAIFSSADFGGTAYFRNAQIRGSGLFSGAVFHKAVTFEGAKFEKRLLFRIDAEASLGAARFCDEANFRSVSVGTMAGFRGVIFEKDVTFVWAHVQGPTTFGNDDKGLHAVEFHGKADFRDSTMDGDGDFDGVAFYGDARFNSVKFGGTATFKGAHFIASAAFDGVHVGEDFVFNDAEFESVNGEAVFDKVVVVGSLFCVKAKFACKASLEGLRVEGIAAQFMNAEFSALATWVNADFHGSAEFNGAKFKPGSEPKFDGTNFSRGGYFQGAEFEEVASFRAVQFQDEAFFHGVKFRKKVHFDAAHFAGMARFDSDGTTPAACFEDEACFDHAKFDRDARFDDTVFRHGGSFREASVRVIYLSPTGRAGTEEQFQGGVNLVGCTYDRIQLDRTSLLKRLDPKTRQPYVQLEKTFRVLGEDKAADLVYLERMRVEGNQLKAGHDFLRWLMDRIYRWGANYGVRPIRLAVFALLVIGFGVTVFQCPQAVHAKAGSSATDCAVTDDRGLSAADATRFSLRMFLPVDIPLLSSCEPTEKRDLGLKYSDWATALRLAGWILVPIGVASLAGLLRRVAP